MELNLTFSSDELTVAMGGLNIMASYREIVNALTRLELHMAALDDAIAALTTSVAAMTAVDTSVIALLNGFSAQLTAAVADALAKGASPAQLAGLTDLNTAIGSQTTAMAAAVAANTPAAPATP